MAYAMAIGAPRQIPRSANRIQLRRIDDRFQIPNPRIEAHVRDITL